MFPLQEGTRLELIFPELKDPTLGVGRRGREECEFLAELGLARVEIRDHLPVRILILRAATMSELVSTARCCQLGTYVRVTDLGDGLVVSVIVLVL